MPLGSPGLVGSPLSGGRSARRTPRAVFVPER